jgi:hypothetical protein
VQKEEYMSEAQYYEPIKEKLVKLFNEKEKEVYLEITAQKGMGEKLKQAIPKERNIVFRFLKKKPDILGYIEERYTKDLIIIEVKEKITKLDDIYQTKLYKEVFDAKYSFLVSLKPIPEEIKRLCNATYNILCSCQDSIHRFFVLGFFNPENATFEDWFKENPFIKETYWK